MEQDKEVIIALFALLGAIAAIFSEKSPLRLPIKNIPIARWASGIASLLVAGCYLILKIWLIKCEYIDFVIGCGGVAILIALGLVIFHKKFLKKNPDGSDLLTLICMGWFVLGLTGFVSLVAAYSFDLEMKKHTLSWRAGAGINDPVHIVHPPKVIPLYARQEWNFVPMQEQCTDLRQTLTLEPKDVAIHNNVGKIVVLNKILYSRNVDVFANAKCHKAVHIARLNLVPDPDFVKREVFEWRIPGDLEGRSVLLDFVIISKDNTWVLGNACELEGKTNGKPSGDVKAAVMKLNDTHLFDNYNSIVAIGTASHEGTDKKLEDSRAQDRSLALAYWVRDITKRKNGIYTLNLGQYQSTENTRENGNASRDERPAVLVGVSYKKGAYGIAEQDLVEKAIAGVVRNNKGSEILDLLFSNYSLREVNEYHEMVKPPSCKKEPNGAGRG
jgi:hypothetical protein